MPAGVPACGPRVRPGLAVVPQDATWETRMESVGKAFRRGDYVEAEMQLHAAIEFAEKFADEDLSAWSTALKVDMQKPSRFTGALKNRRWAYEFDTAAVDGAGRHSAYSDRSGARESAPRLSLSPRRWQVVSMIQRVLANRCWGASLLSRCSSRPCRVLYHSPRPVSVSVGAPITP